MKAIEVRDVYYRYEDGTKALEGVSFDVDAGEKVAILGPNGAGKTTIFDLLTGLRFPQKGSIRIMGERVDERSANDARRHVGLVFQDPDDQIFLPSVWDDVAFGPINLGLTENLVAKRVNSSLLATGLAGFDDRIPHHLSHGEKKRVAIAGVLAMDPEILLLDEPTTDLDGAGRRRLIEDLNNLGNTILVATHDVEAALEITERAIIIDRHIMGGGTYQEIFSQPTLLEQARLEIPPIPWLFSLLESNGFTLGRPTNTKEAYEILKGALRGHSHNDGPERP